MAVLEGKGKEKTSASFLTIILHVLIVSIIYFLCLFLSVLHRMFMYKYCLCKKELYTLTLLNCVQLFHCEVKVQSVIIILCCHDSFVLLCFKGSSSKN